jgi:hypothetical protein
MFDPMFVPPRHSEALYRFTVAAVPWLGRLFGNVHAVRMAREDLERLEALRDSRAILAPNHPTETDPIVLFWLGRLARQRFNFLATRETLDGPRGWLLNRIGTYSVIRGFPDRESLRMTRRLLAELDRKVVIFPEGLVYEHNDRLLEFQSGVAQMGFWALDDLHKAGREPALPIVPVAIKYRCCGDPEQAISRGLLHLEQRLGLPSAVKDDPYLRLKRLGGHVVQVLERAEGVEPPPDADLTARITVVRRKTLERVAQAIGTRINETEPPGEQLHHLFNTLKAWVGVLGDEATEYERGLYRQRVTTAAPLFKELMRLHNTVAVTGDYVASEPTAERFLEVLGRLQQEVFGGVRYQAPLAAVVRVGEPLRLDEVYGDYRADKRRVVAETTRALQGRIRAMLDALGAEATPLNSDYFRAGREQP